MEKTKAEYRKYTFDLPIYYSYSVNGGVGIYNFNPNSYIGPFITAVSIMTKFRNSDVWTSLSSCYEYFRIYSVTLKYLNAGLASSTSPLDLPTIYLNVTSVPDIPTYVSLVSSSVDYLTEDTVTSYDNRLMVNSFAGSLVPPSKNFYFPPIVSTPSYSQVSTVLAQQLSTGITWGSQVWHSFAQIMAFSDIQPLDYNGVVQGFVYPMYVCVANKFMERENKFSPHLVGVLTVEVNIEVAVPFSYTGAVTPFLYPFS